MYICIYVYVALERKRHFVASEQYRGFYNSSIFITGTGGLYRVSFGETQIYRRSYERREQTIVASFSRLPFESTSSEVTPLSNLRRTPLCNGSRQKPN